MVRIELISQTIQAPRTKGTKWTNSEEVKVKLLERFGGRVRRIDNDLVVAPQSINQIVQLLMGQNQKINELQQLIGQKPNPVDHTEMLAEMKNELKKGLEREEQLLAIVQQLQSDLSKF